jgi:hypothetical protein
MSVLDAEQLAQFKRERNEALLSLDRAKIEAHMKKYAASIPKNDDVFWAGVHKARTAIPSLADSRAAEEQGVAGSART